MALPKKVAAAFLHTKMKFARTELDGWFVWLGHKLEPHEAGDFEKKLEELFLRWIDAWRKIHGFKKFLSSVQAQALTED